MKKMENKSPAGQPSDNQPAEKRTVGKTRLSGKKTVNPHSAEAPESKAEKRRASLRSLIYIYRTAKIPWIYILLVVVMTFGTQILNNMAIPYSTKIDLGQMTGKGFIAGYIIISLTYEFFDISYDLVNGLGNVKMATDIRKRLLRKMLHLPIRFYDNEEPQKLVSRITIDSTYAYMALSGSIQLISIVYGIWLAASNMTAIYKNLTWVVLIAVPLMIFFGFLIGKISFRMEQMMNNAYSRQTNYYAERFPNIEYIKNNSMEAYELERGRRINKLKEKTDIKYGFMYMGTSLLNSVATLACSYIVLWVAAGMVRTGSMEMSDMVQLYGYCGEVMANCAMVVTVWQAVQMAFGGSNKIALIDAAEEEDRGGAQTDLSEKDIEFRQVTFGYSDDAEVLKNVSFHIPYGKITAIVGRNGSGKSTAIRLLERLENPSGGEILIGGTPLSDVNLTEWRDKTGYVFQGNQVTNGSIEENLLYGKREAGHEAAAEMAARVGADEFILAKEHGYEEKMTAFDSGLSGGQQQRLAIARALLKQPEYLILDEATSGLDTLSEEAVFEEIRRTMQGKTIIMIAHNKNMIEKAEHFVVLGEGKLLAEGPFAEVREAMYGN